MTTAMREGFNIVNEGMSPMMEVPGSSTIKVEPSINISSK